MPLPCSKSPPRSTRRPTARDGHTLLEVVAAVAILSTALLATLQLFGAHAEAEARIVDSERAHRLLSREIDRVLAAQYRELRSTSFESLHDDADYEVRRTVTSAGANTVEVLLEIRWTDMNGRTLTRSASTARCRKVAP